MGGKTAYIEGLADAGQRLYDAYSTVMTEAKATGRSPHCNSPSLWRPPRASGGEARSSTVPARRFVRRTRTSSRRFSRPARDRTSAWRPRLSPLASPRPTKPHASLQAAPRRRTGPFALGRRLEAATRTSVPALCVRRCRERVTERRTLACSPVAYLTKRRILYASSHTECVFP